MPFCWRRRDDDLLMGINDFITVDTISSRAVYLVSVCFHRHTNGISAKHPNK